MVTTTPLEEELRRLAGTVPDPELPVISLAELGVLRAVRVTGPDSVEVDLTPTYTGCPAVEVMSADIAELLHAHGMREVNVRPVLSPPWSTDDISPEGRRKLHEFGIAPPRPVRGPEGPVTVALGATRTTTPSDAPVAAPDGSLASARTAGTRTGTRAGTATSTDDRPVPCPHCGSARTELLSRFSSTACKALRRCLDCREPFDHFKEL